MLGLNISLTTRNVSMQDHPHRAPGFSKLSPRHVFHLSVGYLAVLLLRRSLHCHVLDDQGKCPGSRCPGSQHNGCPMSLLRASRLKSCAKEETCYLEVLCFEESKGGESSEMLTRGSIVDRRNRRPASLGLPQLEHPASDLHKTISKDSAVTQQCGSAHVGSPLYARWRQDLHPPKE